MDRLDRWMSIVANIGVLAGIVFLAYEIRVNTDAVRADSTASYASTVIEAIAAEPNEVLMAINSEGWNEVPAAGRQYAYNRTLTLMKAGEHAYIQWMEGNLDDRLWEGNDRGMYQLVWSQRFARDSWRGGVRHNFSTEYQRYMDSLIKDVCTRRHCDNLPDWMSADPGLLTGMNSWMNRS